MKRLLVALAFLLVACGGRSSNEVGGGDGGVENDASDAGSWPDAPWLQDNWSAPACGQISVVPEGVAWVGAWSFDGKQTFSPTECNAANDLLGAKRLHVPQFFMMTLPATNLCYQECVKRGTCTAPVHDINDPDPRDWTDQHRLNEPVYVDHTQADTFCKWLGGRLPTLAELARAAQGDTKSPGVAAMTQAAIDCHANPNPESQICGQLAQMDFFFSAQKPRLYDVGQITQDVGPFSHHDLFGSVVEWTQTFLDPTKFCALQDGAQDFVTFPQVDPAHPQHVGLQFASKIERSIAYPSDPFQPGMADDATVAYYLGFRCAFTQ